jgi:pseudouridine kinase
VTAAGAVSIAVLGGALVDVRATTAAPWGPDESMPGRVRFVPGGAGRNVAVNLARLGYRVRLLSVVGVDPLGEWLLRVTAEAAVDVSAVVRGEGPTGVYVTVGREQGGAYCIADAAALERVSTAQIEAWRPATADAAMLVSDANFAETIQPALAGLAAGRPRALLATSRAKAVRLRSVLAGAALLSCNRAEALALTGLPPTLGWQALGTALLVEGVDRVVITRDRDGVGVLSPDEAVEAPAADTRVVDATGAGDAAAAAAIHAVLTGMGVEQTAALVSAAAAKAVGSEDNTPADLASVLG